MLQVIELKLLLDSDVHVSEGATIEEIINLLAANRETVLDDEIQIREVITELEDAFVNETYSSGDAFRKSAAAFSRSVEDTDSHGFYSTEYGWGMNEDMATRMLPYRDVVDYVLGDDQPDDVVFLFRPR